MLNWLCRLLGISEIYPPWMKMSIRMTYTFLIFDIRPFIYSSYSYNGIIAWLHEARYVRDVEHRRLLRMRMLEPFPGVA